MKKISLKKTQNCTAVMLHFYPLEIKANLTIFVESPEKFEEKSYCRTTLDVTLNVTSAVCRTSIKLTLLIKLDFPTLGKPLISKVLVLGSMLGNLDMCWRTSSKYSRLCFCRFMMVHMRPNAALFSCLQRYSESPYLSKRP